MKDRKYKAAIIGCGRIGGFLDSPVDKKIVTHAHAYKASNRFELTSCCDLDTETVSNFISRWGKKIRGYINYDELLKKEELDVLSICTDTKTHAPLLLKALSKDGLKVIICEKPLVEYADELKMVYGAIKANPKKRIVVNFTRRYDPNLNVVEKIIKNGEMGRLLNFSAVFTKGIYHNGCHMFELTERFFGAIKKIQVLENKKIGDDNYGKYFLHSEKCSGTITNFVEKGYSMFEMDIYLETGKIRISESGHKIEVFRRERSRRYPGYYDLQLDMTLNDTLIYSTAHLMRYALELLEKGYSKNRLLEGHIKISRKLLRIRDALSQGTKVISFV
jgi:predicted dehydrogenase